jgi:hypothetical protein
MANPVHQKKQVKADTHNVSAHDVILKKKYTTRWIRTSLVENDTHAPRRRSAFLNFLLACSVLIKLLVSTSSLLGGGSAFLPPLLVGKPCSSSLESPFCCTIDQLLVYDMRRDDLRLFAKMGRRLLFRRHLARYPRDAWVDVVDEYNDVVRRTMSGKLAYLFALIVEAKWGFSQSHPPCPQFWVFESHWTCLLCNYWLLHHQC